MLVAVGSYTEHVGHAPGACGAGVTLFDVDPDAGTVGVRSCYSQIRNPAYLCAHPTLPVLYVVSEIYDGAGELSSLEFTPDFSQVVRRTDLPSGGTVPAYVSLYDEHTLLIAHYGEDAIRHLGASTLGSFRIGADGHLVEPISAVETSGRGPDPTRQLAPHMHCIVRHPYNGDVYAADLGTDQLLRLSVDARGALQIVETTQLAGGVGPRHLVFTPDAAQALVVLELTSQLAVLDVVDGSLRERAYLSLLPAGVDVPGNSGADIAMSSSGARAYASNRGHDSVATFEHDGAGNWAVVAWAPTGSVPRSIALTPDERYLLVAEQQAGSVAILGGPHLERRFAIPTGTPSAVRVIG
jgi:6-phosphogluconolactonase